MQISIKEACDRLGLSRWTVRKLIDMGELEGVKQPGARNGRVTISEASLERYISVHTITPQRSAS